MGSSPDRLAVIGDGAIVVAFGEPGDAAVVDGGRIPRIELDRLIVVGNGAVEVAFAAEREAAIEIGGAVIWGKPDRFIIVGDGVVEIVFLVVGVAARHEHAGVACSRA